MRIYRVSTYNHIAVVETQKGRKVEGNWSSMPRPLYRWVSFDETITTFSTQGASLTLKQVYDKDGGLISEDIESSPITEFRDLLKTNREGFRKDDWDAEKEVWVESAEKPTAFQWTGEGFLELENIAR